MSNGDFSEVLKWYEELQGDRSRSEHATLRRCKSLSEVYLQRAYVDLCQQLDRQGEGVALIAGVLAHLKKDVYNPSESFSFAKQMAAKKTGSGEPNISQIRFQRLLNSDRDQLFRLLIRIVTQVDKFNLQLFAKDLFYWNDRTKKDWAYAYYSPYQDQESGQTTLTTINQEENI